MGSRRKQILMRQKASFEGKLRDRLSFLSEKGIKSPKADKDTLVRKWQAEIRAANKRLRLVADSEKRTEEMAKTKAERAAAPRKEEGGKSQKTTGSPQEAKATAKKAVEEAKEKPADQVKADK